MAIGGCGREDAPPDAQPDPLDGRVFLSQAVDGHDLAPGTTIRLTFDGGRLGATAGCNSLGAPYRLTDGRLAVRGGMSTTEIGCDPARHQQDLWLAEFLQAAPKVAVDAATLTLTTDGVTLHLLDRTVADPDRALVGTTWQVDTVVNGDTASSVPGENRAILEFGADGALVATSPGCTSARLTVNVDEQSLRFGDVTIDSVGCPPPWEAIVAVLRAGEASYAITGARLSITATDVGIGALATD